MSGFTPLCEPDPDVAGIGIVISFLITAWLTVALSTLAIFFHEETDAYDKRWHKVNPRRFSKRASKVLGASISGLDVSQFVTSIGMLIALIATYPNSKDSHALLAVGLTSIAASSQLLSFLALAAIDELHIASLSVRGFFGTVQATILLVLFFTWYFVEGNRLNAIFGFTAVVNTIFRYLPPVVAIVKRLSLLKDLWDATMTLGKKKGYPEFARMERCGTDIQNELTRLGPILNILNYVFLTLYGLSATALATYAIVDLKWNNTICDMSSGADQTWSFGQFLAIALMIAVLVSALDAFFEETRRQQIQSIMSPEKLAGLAPILVTAVHEPLSLLHVDSIDTIKRIQRNFGNTGVSASEPGN